MADGVPNIGDLFGMLGGANPLNAIGKSVEQFRRAVDDLLHAVETFTATMDTLNTVAGRVNRLLDDVEEPIRTVVPQISATVRAAESMVNQLTGPVDRVVPALSALADAFGNPTIGRVPDQVGEFLDVLGDFGSRLGPIVQMMESAGGMFRLGPLSRFLGGSSAEAPPPIPAPPARPVRPVVAVERPPAAAKRTAPTKRTAPSKGAAPAKRPATTRAASAKAAPAAKRAGTPNQPGGAKRS